MKFFKWLKEKNVKKFNFIDLKISAWCGISIGFILATWIHINIWIWVSLAVIFYVWIIRKVFSK